MWDLDKPKIKIKAKKEYPYVNDCSINRSFKIPTHVVIDQIDQKLSTRKSVSFVM